MEINQEQSPIQEILTPRKKGGPGVEWKLFHGVYRYFLLHPDKINEEIGSFLFFFVMDHIAEREVIKKRLSFSKYAEVSQKWEQKDRCWAEKHRDTVESWGAFVGWLEKLVKMYNFYREFD